MKAWLGFTIAVGAAVALTGCSSQSQYPVHFVKRPGPGAFGGTPGSTRRATSATTPSECSRWRRRVGPSPGRRCPPTRPTRHRGMPREPRGGAASQDPSDGGE